jgi:hypothetical protein
MAGFNISGFKANISDYGYLQTNKFIVAFNSPTIMQNTTIDGVPVSQTEGLMQVRAESVKVPGITLIQNDVNRYGVGPLQKMPTNVNFTPNSITFISDRNGEIYKYFYTWLSNIYDFSGIVAPDTNSSASYSVAYKDDYVTDLHVYVYDNGGNMVKDIVMYRAYPESMNEINLGWGDNSALMKITVSMSFRDWAMVGVTDSDNNPDRAVSSAVTTFGGSRTPTLSANPTRTGLN